MATKPLDTEGIHKGGMGKRIFFLVDGALFAELKERISKSLSDQLEAKFHKFSGECCSEEIDAVKKAALTHKVDVMVGIGGGKTADTAKIVSFDIGASIVVAPTIASTDAPCSAVAVRYTSEGVFEETLHLPRNPDMVLVDSALIAAAPLRFLVAGIGDALSTWFEARSNFESRTNNYIAGGYPMPMVGLAIAKTCHDVLMQDAEKAVTSAKNGAITKSLENIIEANILLSGLGFENCGCSAAHGIHDGLTILPEVHGALHGEKVAFGTLCLLMLENRSQEEIVSTIRFCRSLGLPTTLAELGIVENVREKIEKVAMATLSPGAIIYATPVELNADIVRDAILALDALSMSLDAGG